MISKPFRISRTFAFSLTFTVSVPFKFPSNTYVPGNVTLISVPSHVIPTASSSISTFSPSALTKTDFPAVQRSYMSPDLKVVRSEVIAEYLRLTAAVPAAELVLSVPVLLALSVADIFAGSVPFPLSAASAATDSVVSTVCTVLLAVPAEPPHALMVAITADNTIARMPLRRLFFVMKLSFERFSSVLSILDGAGRPWYYTWFEVHSIIHENAAF